MAGAAENQFKCEKCLELREIQLHLYELALVADRPENVHDVLQRKKGVLSKQGIARQKLLLSG
jgi:hypothetical protein